MTTLTPREIVSELDRYIIGQEDAKKHPDDWANRLRED